MNIYPVAIIGAGPAGISAAIQLLRYGVNPLLFEKNIPGGLLRNANLVENYPGFPNGVTGKNLVRLLQKQIEISNVKVINETVTKLKYDEIEETFQLSSSRRDYACRFVLIASGSVPKVFTEVDIENYIGKNVFYEIHPIHGSSGKTIAIAGAGDAAFDYALNLSNANRVSINNRSNKISCLPVLQQRVSENQNATYRDFISIRQIEENDARLKLTWLKDGITFCEIVDYLVFAIGREPNLSFLDENLKGGLNDLEEQESIFRIGDVKNGVYRQAGISIGDGIRAAMKIGRKLSGLSR